MLTAGNVNDCTMFTEVLAGIWMPKPGRGRSWKRPRRVLADKGYSTRAIRAHPRSRGEVAVRDGRIVEVGSRATDLLQRPDLGRIQPGAAADLIAVFGDPFDDIDATSNVDFVIHNGSIHRMPEQGQ